MPFERGTHWENFPAPPGTVPTPQEFTGRFSQPSPYPREKLCYRQIDSVQTDRQ